MPKEMREKMVDAQSNWKVRTQTIDAIMLIIIEQIKKEPVGILN